MTTLLLFTLLFLLAQTAAGAVVISYKIELDDLTPMAIRQALSHYNRDHKVAVALSGGGARGFAQIGVLAELEEAGIDIDIVTGTSMGGIVGGLYAMGMTPAEIEREVAAIDWPSFFSDKPKRRSQLLTRREDSEGELLVLRLDGISPHIPTALTAGQKLINILNSLTQTSTYLSKGDFSNLDYPLAIVATDIVSGRKVVFTSGSLVTAMRATMGIPLAFTPLEMDSMLLMDGGLLDPVPTVDAYDLGADFVIAVNTTSNLLAREEIKNPLDIANQTTTILSALAKRNMLARADYVITPELGSIRATGFDRWQEAVNAGREATKACLVELAASLAQLRQNDQLMTFDSIHVELKLPDTLHRNILAKLENLQSASIEQHQLDKEVRALFQTGFFASLGCRFIHQANHTTLLIEAVPFPEIRKLAITGNEIISESVLTTGLQFYQSPPRTLNELLDCYDRILAHYVRKGYELAQISDARLDTTSGLLEITINEGRISGIEVEGNETTRSWVVRSYFPLRVGQPYSKLKAEKGVREIYASGLFENVSLQLSARQGGVWITIIVREKKPAYAKLGTRYHEEFHPEAFLKLGHANIWGAGHDLSFYSRFSERRKRFQLQMRADRISRPLVTYNLRAYYTNDKIGLFDRDRRIGHRTQKRLGFRFGLGQQIARLGLVDVTARYEKIRHKRQGSEITFDRKLASLRFNMQYDTKDRYTFPHSGRTSRIYLEIAYDVFGTEELYKKFEGYLEAYHQFGRYMNYHPRVSIGLSEDGLPIYEKFYLGGTRQFIGAQTDQLVGDKYFLINNELRVGPIYNFYFSFRYDMGDVFNVLEEFRTSQLRHSYGFILALDTPVGPLSFSYGRAEGKYDNLYLNIGYDF